MEEKRHWITQGMVVGQIAMWAVRQSPYPCPDGLSDVLSVFASSTRHLFDHHKMAEYSRQGLRAMLEQHLLTIPQVRQWNERKNGNKSPFGFTSRYDGPADPDDDFIDLDALRMNIERGVMLECDELGSEWSLAKPRLFERIRKIIFNAPRSFSE